MPGLTSRTLLYLLAGIVLVTWAGLIWGWPRLAGRGAARIALRITALVVAQATMLALILVGANRAGNFYSSWSDLLGRYSGGGRLTALHESRARSASAITVLGATAIRVPGRPRDAAVLERVRVRGCSAKIAMLYPDQYTAAVGMSGYYTAARDRTTGNLYGSSVAHRNENNLDWRLRHLPAPPVSVLVASSARGERNLPGTLAFLHLIHPPMRGYSLILRHGGHNYSTWRRELPQALRWLSGLLTPALPGPAG